MVINSFNTDIGRRCPTIESEGHRYWIDEKGNDHIIFFDNPTGKMLKKMWEQLHAPIRRKRNDKAHRLSR